MELIITELYSYLDQRVKEYKDKYQIDNQYISEKGKLKNDINSFLSDNYPNCKLEMVSPSGDNIIIKQINDSMDISFNYDYNKEEDSHYIYIADFDNIFNAYFHQTIDNKIGFIVFIITNDHGMIVSNETFNLNSTNIENILTELKNKNFNTLELLSLTDDITFTKERINLCHSVVDYIKNIFKQPELTKDNKNGKKLQS